MVDLWLTLLMSSLLRRPIANSEPRFQTSCASRGFGIEVWSVTDREILPIWPGTAVDYPCLRSDHRAARRRNQASMTTSNLWMTDCEHVE